MQRKLEQQEKCKLRTEIEEEVKQWQKMLPDMHVPGFDRSLSGYENYFNY